MTGRVQSAPAGSAEAAALDAAFPSDIDLRRSGHGWPGTFGNVVRETLVGVTDSDTWHLLVEAETRTGTNLVYSGEAAANHSETCDKLTFTDGTVIDIVDIVGLRA